MPLSNASPKSQCVQIFWKDKKKSFATLYQASKEDLPWETTLNHPPDEKLFFLRRFSSVDKAKSPWDYLSPGSHLFLRPQHRKKIDFKSNTLLLQYPLNFIKNTPDLFQWRQMVWHVQGLIEAQQLHKLVLSVQSHYRAEKRIDPYALACKLSIKHPTATVFALELADNIAFVGATPETLFSKKNDAIKCDILAGTLAKKCQSSPCKTLSRTLLTHPQYLCEVQHVETFIRERLLLLCNKIKVDPRYAIFPTSSLLHLHKTAHGVLHKETCNHILFETLHPTPAVAGLPCDLAKNYIYTLEPHDRGFYSGAIGWLGSNTFQAEVSLRCCLIVDKDVYFFAGAGIVAGASADKEWQEIHHKIESIKRFFHE